MDEDCTVWGYTSKPHKIPKGSAWSADGVYIGSDEISFGALGINPQWSDKEPIELTLTVKNETQNRNRKRILPRETTTLSP